MFQKAFKGFVASLMTYSCGVCFAFASSPSAYEEEQARNYDVWQGRYPHSQLLSPDVRTITNQQYTHAIGNLVLNEKPLTNRGEVYISGSVHKKAAHPQAGIGVSYVGPQHANYIQRDENELPRYEAFFRPNGKDPQIGKGAYARHEPKFVEMYSVTQKKMVINNQKDRRSLKATDTEIVFDPGHGVDHAKTITYKGSNSTRDVQNYTPQNAYYNRYIRMPLVKNAEDRGFSCKELAIYPENPLWITRKSGSQITQQPIPEGFIFYLLNRNSGLIEHSFYFSNFYHYMQDIASIPNGQITWKFFVQKYALPTNIVTDIWGHDAISNHQGRRKAQKESERIGYQSLSGRYKVLPSGIWPAAARNALVRTAAIYRMERAAELDMTTENMLQIAKMFNDKEFKYLEFKGTLYSPHLAQYWAQRAYEEVKRKGYRAEDSFYFMQYEEGIPLKAGQMPQLITAFEQKLKQAPNAPHIVKLIEYFEDKDEQKKVSEWSSRLSQLIRNRQLPRSVVINNTNFSQVVSTLSDTRVVNIVLDFAITPKNVDPILEGFKCRAICENSSYEANLNFLEFTNIDSEAFKSLLNSCIFGLL